MGVWLVTGSRYLGSFISEQESEKDLSEEKVTGWKYLVEVLARVVRRLLQTAYAGLQKSLHQEWDFVQRSTQHIGEALLPVKEVLPYSLIDVPYTCRQSIKTTSLSKVFRTRGSTLPRAILRVHSVRTDQQDVH